MTVGLVLLSAVLLTWLDASMTLDNGVALTPPMGWLSWERFECNTNCHTDLDNCISEKLVMEMADFLHKDGYREVGYEYVAIDDCWLADTRDPTTARLRPDPKRFPSGMKALADYVHSKGLKLGIYEDIGTKTCAGFPGSEGHLQKDAQTFADWGIDMLKFDGCNADEGQYDYGYPAMARFLNQTGRHIVYSCEWPMYAKVKPDFHLVAKTCNMFRDLTDIYDSWGSVLGMIQYFGELPGNATEVAGPGAWNDPDQLVIGNFGLSDDQERVQMALYAILASPLMVSVDLRHIRPSSRALLQNKGVVSISQDPLGIQGRRIKQINKLSYWVRPISPTGSYAVAFLYTEDVGWPIKVHVTLSDLGMTSKAGYNVTEAFDGLHLGNLKPHDKLTCFINPTGVYLVRATKMH